MPTIPIVQRRLTPGMRGGGATANGNDPVASAAAGLSQPVSKLGLVLQQKEQKQVEFDEMMRAENEAMKLQRTYEDQLRAGSQTWQYGQDIATPLSTNYTRDSKSVLSSFRTQAGRDHFLRMSRAGVESIYRGARNFEVTQTRSYDAERLNEASSRSVSALYDDPNAYDELNYSFLEFLSTNQTLNDSEKLPIFNSHKNAMAWAQSNAFINGSPAMRTSYMNRYGEGMRQALGAPESDKFDIVTPAERERISAVSIEPHHISAINSVTTDPFEQELLRLVLVNENAGFGRVNDDAISPVGARGAFQIMPDNATAAGMNPEDMHDFESGAKVALNVLRDYRRRFGDDPLVIMAGYNGGFGAAQDIADGKIPTNEERNLYYRYTLAQLGQNGQQQQQGAQSAFELPPHWDDLTHPQKQQLFNALVAGSRADTTARNGMTKTLYDQAMAASQDGITVDPALLDQLSLPNLVEAYGEYEGNRRARALNTRLAVVPARQAMSGMTRGQLESFEYIEAGSSDTYKEDSATFTAAQTAAREMIRQYEADPVKYLGDNNPAIASLYEQEAQIAQAMGVEGADVNALYAQRQQVVQQRSNLLIEEQKRFEGVNEFHNGQERVLSNAQVQDFANTLNSTNPDDVVSTLTDMQNTFGDAHFGVALNQLVASGKVNYGLMMVMNADPRYWREIVTVANKPVADFTSRPLVSTDSASIMEAVNERAISFNLAMDPMNALGGEAMSTYREMLTKLAFDHASRYSLSAQDAVNRASEALSGRYYFSDTVRIPIDLLDRPGMGSLRQAWAAGNVTGQIDRYTRANINLDDILVQDADGQMYGAHLRGVVGAKLNNLEYYTSADDKGVFVYVRDDAGIDQPLYNKDGAPLVFLFEDMFMQETLERARESHTTIQQTMGRVEEAWAAESGEIEEYGRYR